MAPHTHEQLILSPEVLALLQLLLEHEAHTLEKLVHRVVTRHRHTSTDMDDTRNLHMSLQTYEELQGVVIGFFNLLEGALHDATQEQEHVQQLSRMRFPSLLKINSEDHESRALEQSIAKAHEALKQGPEIARETLYKELLKQWHPLNEKKAVKN